MDPELVCLQESHQGNKIAGVCVNEYCPFQGPVCLSCFQQFHQQHLKDVIDFDELRHMQSVAAKQKQLIDALISQLDRTAAHLKKIHAQNPLDETRNLANHSTYQLKILIKQVLFWKLKEELFQSLNQELLKTQSIIVKEINFYSIPFAKQNISFPSCSPQQPSAYAFQSAKWVPPSIQQDNTFNLQCQVIDHKQKEILGVCLNLNCNFFRLVCFNCLQQHDSHLNEILNSEQFHKIEEDCQNLKKKANQICNVLWSLQQQISLIFDRVHGVRFFPNSLYQTASQVQSKAQLIIQILSANLQMNFDSFRIEDQAKLLLISVKEMQSIVKESLLNNSLKIHDLQPQIQPENEPQPKVQVQIQPLNRPQPHLNPSSQLKIQTQDRPQLELVSQIQIQSRFQPPLPFQPQPQIEQKHQSELQIEAKECEKKEQN